MKSLLLVAVFLGLAGDSFAGGFALNLGVGRSNVIVANGFNHGFARQQQVVVLNNHGHAFNRANVAVVASPFAFNAFGTAAVFDRRGNVFQVDPFGQSVLVRGGFNSFGVGVGVNVNRVQTFSTFGGGCASGRCR